MMSKEAGFLAAAFAAPAKGHSGWWRIAILVGVVAGLFVALKLLPVKDWLLGLLEWTRGLGFWGPVVVALFYIVACIFLLPGSILTLGAGFLFGLGKGTLTVSAGSVMGATAAFLVGRFLAREWVAKRVGGNAKFAAIDEAVGEQGWKIVLLTRLSPVFPFVLLNYGFGLTKVSLKNYVLASWIGMLPGTVMYVYLGTLFGSLAELAAGGKQKSAAEWVFLGVGLAVTIVVTVFITKIARRALDKATASATD